MNTIVYGNPAASNVLIQLVDDHDLKVIDNEVDTITMLLNDEFCLIAMKVENWNLDLSPWKAPAVFGDEAFGDGAKDTLASVIRQCSDVSRHYYIGGYSLAGLFALWAVYQTDIFEGAAAASPSIWFPGFLDYMRAETIKTGKVYLSLGRKEEKTRNALMATVGDSIREAFQLLESRNVMCTLEWNPGNHFKDPDLRMARAFAWCLAS